MAGHSLQCGDCGAQLKSVEEAQEHTELTSHTNFSEFIEPVIYLVCIACRKPCNSKTEMDLHTKRTGYGEFADKTIETAKPIELEAPKAAEGNDATADEAGELSHKMIVPIVDKSLRDQLESMGFPPAPIN